MTINLPSPQHPRIPLTSRRTSDSSSCSEVWDNENVSRLSRWNAPPFSTCQTSGGVRYSSTRTPPRLRFQRLAHLGLQPRVEQKKRRIVRSRSKQVLRKSQRRPALPPPEPQLLSRALLNPSIPLRARFVRCVCWWQSYR